MKPYLPSKIKIIVAVISSLVFGALFLASNTGQQKLFSLAIDLVKPADPFQKEAMAAKPDYSIETSWAALPSQPNESNLTPQGFEYQSPNSKRPVDVFYIHGTGYTNGESWTSPMRNKTATGENTRFSLANEASIFNDCCNIYAPRYREASIFTYIAVSAQKRDEILSAVYSDIEGAFDYYIEHYNQERPFIVVSHSQGTHHAMRLMQEKIDIEKLSGKLVAAYLIGGIIKPVTLKYVQNLKHVSACQHSADTMCIIHWDTYGVDGEEKLFPSNDKALCTNPLTWRLDEEYADKTLHMGAAAISGNYTMRFYGSDTAANTLFEPPAAPTQEFTWAQCRNGSLYVADLGATEYAKLGSSKDKSYHGIDFPLFHSNIRHNVKERINAYFVDLD